jgi:hypothetical protein
MFDSASRYATLPDRIFFDSEGREIAYKSRRFLPQGETLPVLGEVKVAQTDRLDLVATRTLGEPLLFWMVADANNAMNPFDLTAVSGRRLRIPVPQS